jgi:hypothetical protein
MISVSSDNAVISRQSSFHTLSNGFLSIVQMAKASDLFGFVEIVSSDLSSSHD